MTVKQGKSDRDRSPDGSTYSNSDRSDIEISETSEVDEDFQQSHDKTKQKKSHTSLNNNIQTGYLDCGLCSQRHKPGQCVMIERSENLAEYRGMLVLHADDEPWDARVCITLPPFNASNF